MYELCREHAVEVAVLDDFSMTVRETNQNALFPVQRVLVHDDVFRIPWPRSGDIEIFRFLLITVWRIKPFQINTTLLNEYNRPHIFGWK